MSIEAQPTDISDASHEELIRIRTLDVNDPVSLYHGFPVEQIRMMREECEPIEASFTLAQTALGGEIEIVKVQVKPKTD